MTLSGHKRRLQKTNGTKENNNSYFIYVPKDWVRENKIPKSTELEMFMNDDYDALLIFSPNISKEKKDKLLEVLQSE